MQQARGRRLRSSLVKMYERILDQVGPLGPTFRRPKTEKIVQMDAEPAASAAEPIPPPEKLLDMEIMTDSEGNRLDQKGDPAGWPSIYAKFSVGVDLQTDTVLSRRTGVQRHSSQRYGTPGRPFGGILLAISLQTATLRISSPPTRKSTLELTPTTHAC